MLNMNVTLFIAIVIGCVLLGAVLTYLTEGFTNFDGLFEPSDNEEVNARLDYLYDLAILNEGYYRHGKTSKENYIAQLTEIQKEVAKIEKEIRQKDCMR